MRTPLFLLLSLALVSCSNQVARVERESAVRSTAEAFENQFDSSGVLQYDHTNGERVFSMQCAGCHGEKGTTIPVSRDGIPQSLGGSARANPHRFWKTLYFGDDARNMPAYGKSLAFQDLVDATGYAMRLE